MCVSGGSGKRQALFQEGESVRDFRFGRPRAPRSRGARRAPLDGARSLRIEVRVRIIEGHRVPHATRDDVHDVRDVLALKRRRRLSGGENRRAAGQSRVARTGSLSQTFGQRDVLLASRRGSRRRPTESTARRIPETNGFVQQHFKSTEGRGGVSLMRARTQERRRRVRGDCVVVAVGRSCLAEREARLPARPSSLAESLSPDRAGDEIRSSARAVSRQRRVPERLSDDFPWAAQRVAVRKPDSKSGVAACFFPRLSRFARDEHTADRFISGPSAPRAPRPESQPRKRSNPTQRRRARWSARLVPPPAPLVATRD